MNGNAVIVIPTYNEAPTAPGLAHSILSRIAPGLPQWKISVLVVDGNSPDGTADRIREIQERDSRLHLIVETKKEGIGAAYFKGFEHAVRNLKADVLVEFDGDLQHPPEAIPRLLEEIDQGADLVLGSRRMRGGSYPKGLGFRRLFLSKAGGLLARCLLFFPGRAFFRISDPTTGLRALRVAGFYGNLDLRALSKGFSYKVEMLHQLVRMGADVREIPFAFGVRRQGESKSTRQTPAEMLGAVLRLRAGSYSALSRILLSFWTKPAGSESSPPSRRSA